eukprot:scaffold4453_cov65-Phaeocystis_antarctica.AAC.3
MRRPYAPRLFVIETPEYRAVVAGETFMMSPAKATWLDGSSWTKPAASCSLIILRNLPCLRVVSSRGTSVRACATRSYQLTAGLSAPCRRNA